MKDFWEGMSTLAKICALATVVYLSLAYCCRAKEVGIENPPPPDPDPNPAACPCELPRKPIVQTQLVWSPQGLSEWSMSKQDAIKLRGELVKSALGALIQKSNLTDENIVAIRRDVARQAVAFADETLLAMGVYAVEIVKLKAEAE